MRPKINLKCPRKIQVHSKLSFPVNYLLREFQSFWKFSNFQILKFFDFFSKLKPIFHACATGWTFDSRILSLVKNHNRLLTFWIRSSRKEVWNLNNLFTIFTAAKNAFTGPNFTIFINFGILKSSKSNSNFQISSQKRIFLLASKKSIKTGRFWLENGRWCLKSGHSGLKIIVFTQKMI